MRNDQFKRQLFRIISRLAFGTYRRFPVFGALRASIGIIRNHDRYLAIDRSDGRGYSFPGGLASPWEDDEAALRREVKEETGLSVVEARPVLRYFSQVVIPCHIAVFEVSAQGDLRGSWEGKPVWATLSDLEARIMASQRPTIIALIQDPGLAGRPEFAEPSEIHP
jgi:8-oxo-dGTP pyrophosphatase MutT (NUDIX family)